ARHGNKKDTVILEKTFFIIKSSAKNVTENVLVLSSFRPGDMNGWIRFGAVRMLLNSKQIYQRGNGVASQPICLFDNTLRKKPSIFEIADLAFIVSFRVKALYLADTRYIYL